MHKVSSESVIDKPALMSYLRQQFRLDWHGRHGVPHWARVRVNGLLLAQRTGANPHVVELFAFFHDSRRLNEHLDEGHGERGAELARSLNGRFFSASDTEMAQLVKACNQHSDGRNYADPTVMTCWDADRLDLGRVGMVPNPDYLCTEAAKDRNTLRQAHARAIAWKEYWLAKKR